MSLFDLFRKDEVIGAKVLVCALQTGFDDLLEQDHEVYRQYYPATSKAIFPSIEALSGGIGQGFDVIHLLCDVSDRGTIMDSNGKEITGTDLIHTCCDQNVKLLWIASDNPSERYITGFGARGKRLNLVMTLRRKGSDFPDFLQKLLFRMFYGDTMPVAWNDLCPQIPGSDHPGMPDSIFFAGRGGVRLR